MISQSVRDKLESAVELWAEDNLNGKPALLANCVYLSLLATWESKVAEIEGTFGNKPTQPIAEDKRGL